ncbi:hypothetical protein MNAN1_002201 [Malassezia nana]|uniref:Citrate transporter-like domain-containing protein n=1 Tax=Malassezia nana TaxID=180528 RepID=A0AAF0J7M7_9BASI|nr:hypothetical protein MNAN1_002201 [Malassezia nana]
MPEAEQQDLMETIRIPLTHVTVPIIGVLLLLMTRSIDGQQVRDGIAGESGVLPYDILLLFLSLAYIAISLDATGLLRYLACHVCQRASFDGRVLYMVMYFFLWLAGVVLGNDPVILSGTAFLVYMTRTAGISPPDAWLWAQFVAANVASAVLVSSNPTNLVIATGFGLSFVKYTAYMVLPSFASACVTLVVLMLYFGLRRPREPSMDEKSSETSTEHRGYIPQRILSPDMDPKSLLVDPIGAVFTSVIMLAVIGVLIGTSAIGHVKVFQIGIPGAVLCLFRDIGADLHRRTKNVSSESDLDRVGGHLAWIGRLWRSIKHTFPTTLHTLRRLPLELLPFAFGMFILVQALNHVGFITIMARGVGNVCQHGVAATVFFMAVLSIILCNFGGTNIGSTILLTKVMQSPAFLQALYKDKDLILKAGMYSVAYGSNLGALGGTFAASLAGFLWLDMLSHQDVYVTRWQFAVWCTVAVLPAMGAGLSVLLAQVLYFQGL